ncbi:MAG: hypothetical protein NTV44_00310 [Firmicutes bacterium]|nr:hypothetical protein [Bacillota bacterium]
MLFLATSNILSWNYINFAQSNLVISITLLSLIVLCNLAAIINQVSLRLNKLDNFSKILRR